MGYETDDGDTRGDTRSLRMANGLCTFVLRCALPRTICPHTQLEQISSPFQVTKRRGLLRLNTIQTDSLWIYTPDLR